jgi:hypothetical protein
LFAEVFLFPVWHLGPIPFKISLFIVLFSLMKGIPKLNIIAAFIGIILLLWTGKIYSLLFFNEYQITDTIRITINYLIIIAGLLYSQKIKPLDNLNWLALLTLSYAIINLIVFVLAAKVPALASFYNLNIRLEEGLFLVRNPGINTNPNGSALMGNLLLLFYVVAKRNNLITLNSKLWDVIVFSLLFIAMISFQSRSGLIAYSIIISWYFIKRLSIKTVLQYIILILFAGLISVKSVQFFMPEQFNVIKRGVDIILNINEQISTDLKRNRNVDGNRIYKLNAMFENFKKSPIVGVGSDRTSGRKLNRVWYHNDLSEVLVSTGIFGLILYILVIFWVKKVNFILITPFLFPGLTNSFLFTMQIVGFFFLFTGIIYKKKRLNY